MYKFLLRVHLPQRHHDEQFSLENPNVYCPAILVQYQAVQDSRCNRWLSQASGKVLLYHQTVKEHILLLIQRAVQDLCFLDLVRFLQFLVWQYSR